MNYVGRNDDQTGSYVILIKSNQIIDDDNWFVDKLNLTKFYYKTSW